jgi:hypothetical protein
MTEQEFAQLVSCEFYFDLVKKCHASYVENRSKPHVQRMLNAISAGPLKEHIDYVFSLLAKRDAAAHFLNWLDKELLACSDEAGQFLSRPELANLHYRHFTDAGAGWHNLRVPSERSHLALELTEHLRKRFAHWKAEDISKRLPEVPPLLLLEDELSPYELLAVSALSIDFAIAFVKSTYIVHLGRDPIGINFSLAQNGLLDALREHRPRHVNTSHLHFFKEVRQHPPFREAYGTAVNQTLPGLGVRSDFEEVLLGLTFRLSLPYAHSIITSPEFVECMSSSGPLGSAGNYFRTLDWAVQQSHYLERFCNPSGISTLDLAQCTPLGAELFAIALGGTFERELYTPLDRANPAPDNEFDD